MSSLVLTAAGQVGSSLVRTAQRTALSLANRAISNAFDTRNFEGPRLDSFHVQTSRDGAPMPRVYGRVRIAGQVIWASKLTENKSTDSVSGKGGGPTQTQYSYTISFAIGLCEGEILSVDRIWANGTVLNTQGLSFRVYKGSNNQMPDPIISAVEGGAVPAFRGTAYIVFEDFPLDVFGNRLPQINVEIIRVPKQINGFDRMETMTTGVNLLPSSGEFAYSPDIKEQIVGPGSATALNMNNNSGASDFSKAIDQLENELPNCKSVSIIISWFGTDLRCGSCEIRPGVEDREREIVGPDWEVGSDRRDSAFLVSRDNENRPNFGGTPSDQSIIDSIIDLKARGFKVSLYPFILMDVPSDNTLPDPYSDGLQAVFPWRGRITCDPAPNRAGSPDKTSAVMAQTDAFFGTCQPSDFTVENGKIIYSGPSEYGFRRFILHYAKLAALAGGVDRFVIGSEMRGVTTLRSGTGQYPAVDQFVDLAVDVKSILGSHTDLTYAADWTEYFGHHPQDGSADVSFHLDPLWTSAAISAIGIDAYFPLSDWRDGDSHLDAVLARDIYDLEYLKSQMEGGEGFEWYYNSTHDRAAQNRTLITDGAYQKLWVYRYKDIRNWWSQPHYNRVNGVELSIPTAWVPQSKPIWFTEIGCPAIDKGSNQPNVFVDPKSSESFVPYHSSGGRDDLIQRRYIEAFISYWKTDLGNNPVSDVYNAPMVELDALHVWCWDARPFPEFPALDSVWSDGGNWQLGHWLTGRTGLIPLADVVADVVQSAGISNFDTSKVNGTLQGYVIDRPMCARAVLSPLATVYGFNMVETARHVRFVSFGAETVLDLNDRTLAGESLSQINYIKEDQTLRLKDVRLHFIDSQNNYQLGSVSARDKAAETVRVLDMNAPLVLGKSFAGYVCDQILDRAHKSAQSLTFKLPLNMLELEVGDVIRLSENNAEWRVEGLETGQYREVTARLKEGAFVAPVSSQSPTGISVPIWIAEPDIIILDIPQVGETTGPYIGVSLSPFAPVRVASKLEDGFPDILLDQGVQIGVLETPLLKGPIGRWDYANEFSIRFLGSELNSVSKEALLGGANRFALQTPTGWEVLQARDIELIGEKTYQLKTLLRGLSGSNTEMTDHVETGARLVKLDTTLKALNIANDLIGSDLQFDVQTAKRAVSFQSFFYKALHLRPLAPVHGRMKAEGAQTYLSWIRQSRLGGENWVALEIPLGEAREFYRVQIMQASTVLKTVETSRPEIILESDQIVGADRVDITQGSDIYGYGTPLQILL